MSDMEEVLRKLEKYGRENICQFGAECEKVFEEYSPYAEREFLLAAVLDCAGEVAYQDGLEVSTDNKEMYNLFTKPAELYKFCLLTAAYQAVDDIAVNTFKRLARYFQKQLPLQAGTEASALLSDAVEQTNKLLSLAGDTGKWLCYALFVRAGIYVSIAGYRTSDGVVYPVFHKSIAELDTLLKELLGLSAATETKEVKPLTSFK